MKKYNLSAIMKRAWELVKKAELTISMALKKAWKEVKEVKEKFEKSVKVLKEGCEGYEESASNWFSFNLWEKGSLKRIYVNDYKRRTLGFIDFNTHEINTEYSEKSDIYHEMVRFTENYEF